MKADNTVAALHIPQYNCQNHYNAQQSMPCRTVLPQKPPLLSYTFNSLSSTHHISSLLFSPQPHSHPPSQIIYPTHLLFSHIFFTEQHSYYSPHVQRTSYTMLTHQNEGEKSETMKNQAIPYLMHQSQIGTNDT